MTVLRGGYQGATSCTGSARVGTKNLMAVFLALYSGVGGRNLGIYNCRPIRGTNRTTSLHGEGRAGDHGCPVGNGFMQAWCDFLVAHSAELGIQCVIYNRRIWSSSYPDAWRNYGGTVPHTDHAHVEQTRHSADTLTVDRIWQIWNGAHAKPSPAPAPAPSVGRPLLKLGMNDNPHVRDWQNHLRTIYPAYRHESPVRRGVLLAVDGDFGPWTEAWTKLFQRKSRITVDGKVGPQTWRTAGFR